MYREKLEELDSNFEETEAAGSIDMANRLAAQQRLESENQYLTSLVVKVRPAKASLPKPAHTSLLVALPLVMRNIQPPGPEDSGSAAETPSDYVCFVGNSAHS
jgi:hypothetical protein